ncbi:MAG: sulfite exporter TauE/SafE family protein [Flavobacteriales bacterium]|nr:sulfite exporter TauE/SafE family protein [Flavobacteriales bacterium]
MEVLFFISLPVISFLYASVGHGGASGYLALMVLFSFATEDIRTIALTLNLCVAGISFLHFKKEGHFKINLFYPFIMGSIPAAFIGGMLEIDSYWYKRILGIFLLIATIRFMVQKKKSDENIPINIGLAIFIGSIIGLFSGMIGIGGGIILSPVILLLGWGNLKETAAVSALFIFINSAFGLAGNYFSDFQLAFGISSEKLILILFLAVAGGYAGSHWGSRLKSIDILKFVLAGILAIASVKLWLI